MGRGRFVVGSMAVRRRDMIFIVHTHELPEAETANDLLTQIGRKVSAYC